MSLHQPGDSEGFFSQNEHAEQAIFKSKDGSVVKYCSVIFNETFTGLDAGGTVVIEINQPMLYVNAFGTNIKKGDKLNIQDIWYTSREVRNEQGVYEIRLTK